MLVFSLYSILALGQPFTERQQRKRAARSRYYRPRQTNQHSPLRNKSARDSESLRAE